MPDSKLMSYITSDFQSQSDLKVGQMEWEKIMEEKFKKIQKCWSTSSNGISNLE